MQIYERVAAEMPNVSLTTVYRNLNRLTADGKIRRITIPNEPDRFDKTVYDHYHIACEVCGFFGDVTSVRSTARSQGASQRERLRRCVQTKSSFGACARAARQK